MVNTAFYYKKYGHPVCCFYCGGRLFQWKAYDNPWYNHAKWFPLCEYILKKRSVEYVKNVCSKHMDLKRPQIENPTLSTAANQICSLLFVEAKQNLNEMMMCDPHVKFAKNIGVKDTKICHALMQQLEKHDCNFENLQELLNAILDLNKEDKCMKCKSNKKNAVGMPCEHTDLLLELFPRHAILLIMFTKIDRKNPRVQSLKFFFFFVVIKTYAVTKAHNMEAYTNQADELHRQANKIKHPPPYTSCYETMMEQEQLLSQAREMESAARDI